MIANSCITGLNFFIKKIITRNTTFTAFLSMFENIIPGKVKFYANRPVVMVPVLSRTTVSTEAAASKVLVRLIMMPSRAAEAKAAAAEKAAAENAARAAAAKAKAEEAKAAKADKRRAFLVGKLQV